MRMPRRGCCRGELARTRSCSPRWSCGVPRPTPPRYRRPGKRSLRPDPRAPPRVRSSPRSLDAEPLSAWGADPELPAPDSSHTCDGGVLERVAKSVSADHSGRTHDYKACLARCRNVHGRPRRAVSTVMTVRAPPASRRRAGAPQTATPAKASDPWRSCTPRSECLR